MTQMQNKSALLQNSCGHKPCFHRFTASTEDAKGQNRYRVKIDLDVHDKPSSCIECIAFSPPGGLMSPSLCEYTKRFVRSIVIGDDIVSRISMKNFDRLRDQVVRYGCRSSERKFLIPFKRKFGEFSVMRKGKMRILYLTHFTRNNPSNPNTL